MKLRNKKTGEIVELSDEEYDAYKVFTKLLDNADWVEYKPTEPLIKDEKIRKAIRAWAEAVDANSAYVEKGYYENDQFALSDGMAEIHFRISIPEGIRFYKSYTIAELCGEEEG